VSARNWKGAASTPRARLAHITTFADPAAAIRRPAAAAKRKIGANKQKGSSLISNARHVDYRRARKELRTNVDLEGGTHALIEVLSGGEETSWQRRSQLKHKI